MTSVLQSAAQANEEAAMAIKYDGYLNVLFVADLRRGA